MNPFSQLNKLRKVDQNDVAQQFHSLEIFANQERLKNELQEFNKKMSMQYEKYMKEKVYFPYDETKINELYNNLMEHDQTEKAKTLALKIAKELVDDVRLIAAILPASNVEKWSSIKNQKQSIIDFYKKAGEQREVDRWSKLSDVDELYDDAEKKELVDKLTTKLASSDCPTIKDSELINRIASLINQLKHC